MMTGGTVNAQESTITGDGTGLLLTSGTDAGTDYHNDVTLENTVVTGTNGSGITVAKTTTGTGGVSDILLINGTVVNSGNGIALEVKDNSTANATIDNSHIEGDIQVDAGSHANLTLKNNGQLTGAINNADTLKIDGTSQSNMTGDSQLGDLTLDGGRVKFGELDQFLTLNLKTLAGSGTFLMGADFSQNKIDFLNIEGNASGNHQLLVESSGKEPVDAQDMHVVHTGGGDANFSLAGGPVDVGVWSYGLKQSGNDWFLDPEQKTIAPSTKSVIALYNTAPTVWYGEMTSLRTRMVELRTDTNNTGVWMRTYGNRNDVKNASGFGYQQKQYGVSLGADTALGESNWLLGLMAGESHSTLDLDRGTTGSVDSYYAGVYTTWLDPETGYYFDGVVKANRFLNDSDVTMSDGSKSGGDYNTVGLGTSLEFGRHIKLGKGYFIEPYTQVSGVVIRGKDYRLDNDMQADVNTNRSLLGKLGTTFGNTIDLGRDKMVQPYLRVAMAQEFAKNNQVRVNDNQFNNDLSGTRGEVGAGVAISLSKNMQIHVDYEYSKGHNIEQPWNANIGARYSF